jgi:NADH-quinone oxidoreductase subunit C
MEQAAIHELLTGKFGDAITAWHGEGVEPHALVAADRIVEIARFLREDERLSFDLLMCLSGIDWDGYDEAGKGKSVAILGYTEDGRPETSEREAEGDLAVAYHLYSYRYEHKFTLQVRVPRAQATVPSVSGIWPTAAWHEREAYDLVGIRFSGHPDLRRILLEDSWEGHPLRKDYRMPAAWQGVPLEGRPYSVNPWKKDEPAPEADGPSEG